MLCENMLFQKKKKHIFRNKLKKKLETSIRLIYLFINSKWRILKKEFLPNFINYREFINTKKYIETKRDDTKRLTMKFVKLFYNLTSNFWLLKKKKKKKEKFNREWPDVSKENERIKTSIGL